MRHFKVRSSDRCSPINFLIPNGPGRRPGNSRKSVVNLLVLIAVTSLLTACTNEKPEAGDRIHYYEVTTRKPYDEVLDELKIAISEHNFRITAHSRVGKVIRNRGTPDFPDYDTIQFCNLSRAKTLLEISPDAVRHMPCSVVVYTRNGHTVIQARLLPVDTDMPELNAFSKSINEMLKQIVDFAAEI